jgi:aspartate aminotransferase
MKRGSHRGMDAPSSPIRKLVPHADGARERGTHVYHLNIGQPDIETPLVMRQALSNYADEVIAYGPSGGDAPFRSYLMEYYSALGADLRPHDLLVTTGGSEAVSFAFAACLDPGDEILIPDPMYANYLGYASMLGNKVIPIPTRVEEGYHLPESLDGLVTPRTKAVLLCNPANPTGIVYTEDEVARILDLVQRHDLFLIADEVYREFVYDGPTTRSVLTWPEVADRTVVVDSLSKRFSLCGARIGCVVSRNESVMASAMKFAQARLSPPALAQVVAAQAVNVPSEYFDGVRTEYRRRRDVVYESLSGIDGVLVHRPEGAFYQMARLPVSDSEDFVRFMLDEFQLDGATTMVAPGGGFYAADGVGRDEVRIAYVLNENDLRRAMAVLAAGLTAYRQNRV